MVINGTRIIVPKQCKEEVLLKLHEGHFGSDRTKLQARDSVYWPRINKEIENMIKTCQENSRRKTKNPVLTRKIPLVPWTLLEMDVFMIEDHTFSLVVDVTSHFPLVRILINKTSKAVINSLKGIYTGFGLPRRVLSDIGLYFRAEKFNNFHTKLNIIIKKSSAYKYQSVGSVEMNGSDNYAFYDKKHRSCMACNTHI